MKPGKEAVYSAANEKVQRTEYPTKMKKKIFLHIGTNKAGSSAIQEFLVGNEPKLKQLGYLYPKTGRVSNAHYRISGCLKIGVNPPHNGKVFSTQQTKDHLASEISASKFDKIIISSEYFILCRDTDKIKNFFEGKEVYIIVYLRRHDHWFESFYNQGVKTSPVDPQWGAPIGEIIAFITKTNPQEFDFWKLLKPWSRTFGSSNILVQPFEQEQFKGGSIYIDFLDAINIKDSASFEIPSTVTNSSLDNDTVFIFDRIARMNISDNAKKQLFSWLISYQFIDRTAVEHPPFKQPLLSPQQRMDLILRYEPSYRKVAESYLQRSDGRLFFSDLPDRNEPWQDYKGPDAASNLHYTNIIFNQLINEVALLRNKVASLEKQIERQALEKID